jgi:hypothetical protein
VWGFSEVLYLTSWRRSRERPYIQFMVRPPQLDDTSNDVRSVQQALYASMTPSQKLRRMSELTMAVNRLALAGLAGRHPDESQQGLLLRLARLRLGDDLVDRAYGIRDGA